MTRSARVTTLAEGVVQSTVAVPVFFDQGAAVVAEAVPDELGGHALPRSFSKEWCQQQGLKEEPGSSTVIRGFSGPNVALVTVGSTFNDLNHYRLAGAVAVRCAGDGNAAFLLPTGGLDAPKEVAQALVEGALLASYSFKAKASDASFDVVPLGSPLPTVAVHDSVTLGVSNGAAVADGVNWAKRLIDSPAGVMGPRELADEIMSHVDSDPRIVIDAWTEPRIKEERLGGLLGVGQGSAQPTRLVYATYDPAPGAPLPHVALVGKGITFDSGGLSLKTLEGMMSMKTDMSGAAIVFAALSIASRLDLAVRLTVIAPLAENLPGGKAVKPGDVLTARNGTTIEVLNTDAEGRLVLADGLSLAAEVNPDAIVDIATLTGAQSVALGDEVGAIFATTDELAAKILAASARCGEPFWRLPLYEGYESHIESDIADVKNMGKPPRAGAIVAALMLRHFTDGRPWAHLDIAGPARSESARGYSTKGATAFGTRTIVNYLAAVADVPSG